MDTLLCVCILTTQRGVGILGLVLLTRELKDRPRPPRNCLSGDLEPGLRNWALVCPLFTAGAGRGSAPRARALGFPDCALGFGSQARLRCTGHIP